VGRIFRRFDSPRVLDGAYVAAADDAETLLRDARARADEIVLDAERRAHTHVEARLCEAERQALAILHAASHEAARVATLAEPELVELALAVTARVVAHASAVDVNLVREEASRAIASLSRARTLTLMCHTEDLDALGGVVRDDTRVRVEVDPALARGDVVVRSDIGRVDARLSTRLENVARALGRHG